MAEFQDNKNCDYINLGCGTVRYPNCLNMDIANIPKMVDLDVVGSVLDIPFDKETFKGAIFSHVLEHLLMREHKFALLEIRRILKEDGTLYLEVPDLEKSMENFLSNYKGRREYWYMCIYGREDYASDVHRSGITEQYLTDLLFECGYGHLKWFPEAKKDAILAVIATKLKERPDVRL